MFKIRKNDEVVVIAGKYKGSVGRVLEVNRAKNTVTVDKVNVVKKHVKPTQTNPEGGIREFEAPIHISNVALNIKGKEGGATRVAIKIDEKGKKSRVAVKTGKEL